MKKIILFAAVLFLGVALTGTAYTQQKDKKENSQTTKVDSKKNNDSKLDEVVSVTEGKPVNSVCPVSGEELDKDQQLVKYKGEIIGLCCKKCLKKIKADPEKYLKRLKRDKEADKE